MNVQNLREINDEYGYGVGDEALKGMAEALMESSRTTDLIARYGSDEFVVLLIDAQASDCDVIIQRVNAKLMQLVARKTLPVPVRYDVGIAVSAEAPEKVEPLLRAAGTTRRRKTRNLRRRASPESILPPPEPGSPSVEPGPGWPPQAGKPPLRFESGSHQLGPTAL